MFPSTGASAAPRSARKDAVRNDRLVLNAARAVFSEQGPQASMEDIAERAGVGVGTIYRRFAGKDALLDAIAALLVAEMDEAAAAALDDPDPAHALERFLEFVGAFNSEKRRYATVLIDRAPNNGVAEGTTDKVGQLVRRAVAAHALAPGVTAGDVKALIVALRGVVASSADGDDTTWRRFLSAHLTGLRNLS